MVTVLWLIMSLLKSTIKTFDTSEFFNHDFFHTISQLLRPEFDQFKSTWICKGAQ